MQVRGEEKRKEGRVAGMDDSSMVVISDDEKVKLPEEEEEKVEEDVEDLEEPPDWLPDGWIMEVNHGDDGTIYRYYTSPVSNFTFTMKSEVLHYLFSEMDERILESQDCAMGNTLQRTHEWLPKGWVIELRAGGEKMDKMYKFYVHPPTGVRLFSKEDVLLYVKEMKITRCDTSGQCDTSTDDNILARVEFNPCALPEGWVKEVVFRKTKEGVRKDPYYTDPITRYVFRTLKSAMRYLETGKITKRSFIQKTGVHDLYSFEKSADLHDSLRKRLTINEKADQKPIRSSLVENIFSNDQISYSSEDGDTSSDSDSPYEPKEIKLKGTETAGKKATSSKTTKRPRGRPPKIVKQTNINTNGTEREEQMVKITEVRAKGEIKLETEL